MKNLAEVAENFPSKTTLFRDPSMAVHDVILDCDWFVLGAERLIKQIAFFDTRSGMSLLYVFQFPKQANHSQEERHELPYLDHGIE